MKKWFLESGFQNPSCAVLALLKISGCLRRQYSFNFFLFLLGFASRKREEENKRKEAEQQKGWLRPDSSRPQALPCLRSPSRQSRAPSQQPPADRTAQGPEPRDSRGSPGSFPARAPRREQHVSPDLQRTESRKSKGRCCLCEPRLRLFSLVYFNHLHFRQLLCCTNPAILWWFCLFICLAFLFLAFLWVTRTFFFFF